LFLPAHSLANSAAASASPLPAWKELAALLDDQADRFQAIERGLGGNPDPDTQGMLLISKAVIMAGRGDRDTAFSMLAELALAPQSTLAAEHLAKAMLARLSPAKSASLYG